MLLNALRVSAEKNQGKHPLYLRNALKETLQAYLLNFVYTSTYASQLLFKGGTCLRYCFQLPRLSEDLDFDVKDFPNFDHQQFVAQLQKYVTATLLYPDMTFDIRGQNKIIYLRFPVYEQLGLILSSGRASDNVLHLRIDLAPIAGQGYAEEVSLQSTADFAFLIRRYALPDLFAGKVAAILRRETWENGVIEPRFKGRDFFDIWWLKEKGVVWNSAYLRSLVELSSESVVVAALNDKITQAAARQQFIRQDLLPFFAQPEFVDDFVANLNQLRF